jgi:hypothetical protein
MIHPNFDNLKGADRRAAWLAMTPAEQEAWKSARIPPPEPPPVMVRPQAQIPRGGWVCTQCHQVGHPTKRGHIVMELALWVLFCAPGFVYSVWRHTAPGICRSCEGPMVKVSSPAGRSMLGAR